MISSHTLIRFPLSARLFTFVAMPLRAFLMYEGERHETFIPDGSTVADIRADVKNRFLLGGDDGKPDKKVGVEEIIISRKKAPYMRKNVLWSPLDWRFDPRLPVL